MARKPPVEFPIAIYRVIVLGNHRTEKGVASLYLSAQNQLYPIASSSSLALLKERMAN